MADHASLTGASLHEPKGVAAAAAGTVYKANGSGSGSWTTIDYSSVPAGFLLTQAYSQVSTAFSTSTAIPIDDTIPQNTEGTEVLTATITPKVSTSILKITVSLQIAQSDNAHVTAALFVDTTAAAIFARTMYISAGAGSQRVQSLDFHFYVVAGSTAARTYKVRIGPPTSGSTAYLNQNNAGGLLGNVEYSSLSIEEIKA